MSGHEILHVRSLDRQGFPLGSANSFVVNLPKTYNSINSIQLLSAEIPVSWYNCSGLYSYGVTFTNSYSQSVVFSLPSQNVAISDIQSLLLTSLQSGLTSSGVTSVTFNSSTNQLSVNFTSGTITASVTSNTNGLLYTVLGIDPVSQPIGSGGVLTFKNSVNLNPISSIYIKINNIPTNVSSTAGFVSTFRAQVTSAFGTYLLVNNASNVYNTFTPTSAINTGVSSLTISVLDNTGNLINFNGKDVEITVGLTIS